MIKFAWANFEQNVISRFIVWFHRLRPHLCRSATYTASSVCLFWIYILASEITLRWCLMLAVGVPMTTSYSAATLECYVAGNRLDTPSNYIIMICGRYDEFCSVNNAVIQVRHHKYLNNWGMTHMYHQQSGRSDHCMQIHIDHNLRLS